MPTDTTAVPSHLTKVKAERFKNVIQEILRVWPRTVSFTSSTLSGLTASARLRDAIRSYCLYDWGEVDSKQLLGIRRELDVTYEDNTVFAGPKVHKSIITINEPEVEVPTTNVRAALDSPSAERLEQVCSLIAQKLYPTPIRVSGVSVELLSALQEKYDIAFTLEENGNGKTYIVL
jgi:hypothetical protein